MSKPTRDEVELAIYSVLEDWYPDTDVEAGEVARIIQVRMVALGLEVAPEPTPEPDDPENYRVVDADNDTWRHWPTNWMRLGDAFLGHWQDIQQPVTLYRKVGE